MCPDYPMTTIQVEDKIHSIPSGEEHLHNILDPCPCQPTTHSNCLLHHPLDFDTTNLKVTVWHRESP